MEFQECELNLFDIPLTALNPATRQIIINGLNKRKVILSETGLPRDWNGLAHQIGLSSCGDNPASYLLWAWEKEGSASLGLLEQYLANMDRWDIIDDISAHIRKDAIYFIQQNSKPENTKSFTKNMDDLVLTYDDFSRFDQGMALETYDALLLYADEDHECAYQMKEKLQFDYDLKVCLTDDFITGKIIHEDMIWLIMERCNHVVVLVSPHFTCSNLISFINKFSKTAAVVSYEKQRRTIIPCILRGEHIKLPGDMNYLQKLYYSRVHVNNYDFWGRLRNAIAPTTSCRYMKSTPKLLQNNSISMPNIISEITAEDKRELYSEHDDKLADNNLDMHHILKRRKSQSSSSFNIKKPKSTKSFKKFFLKLFRPYSNKKSI